MKMKRILLICFYLSKVTFVNHLLLPWTLSNIILCFPLSTCISSCGKYEAKSLTSPEATCSLNPSTEMKRLHLQQNKLINFKNMKKKKRMAKEIIEMMREGIEHKHIGSRLPCMFWAELKFNIV